MILVLNCFYNSKNLTDAQGLNLDAVHTIFYMFKNKLFTKIYIRFYR